MSEKTPAWGIEPVPDRLRVLGGVDTFLLWFNLSVSLLVIVAGTLLVPALSLRDALLAILIAAIAGNLMLGLAGLIGADARVPAMVLLRAPLGQRGSYVPTALNVAQCLGWSVFELLIISTAAAALSQRVFGFEGRWLWTLAFGGLTVALALPRPRRLRAPLRAQVRRLDRARLAPLPDLVDPRRGAPARALGRPGQGGLPFWAAVDLVLASIVSWTPLAADYTRFSRDRRSAFFGVGLGYLVPTLWLFPMGALLLLSRDLSDPATLPAAVAAGGLASVLALGALTVDESDEAFANVYSTAVSLQNLFPRVSQRLLIVLVTAVATTGALLIDLRDYQPFLFLLGSFFVPLFGVLLADWLISGRHYSRDDVFAGPTVRPGGIVAWLAGFSLYQWIEPVGPGWWTSLVAHAHPGGLHTGASLPAFAAAFALTAGFARSSESSQAASRGGCRVRHSPVPTRSASPSPGPARSSDGHVPGSGTGTCRSRD